MTRADRCRLVATLGIGAIVVTRACTFFAPRLFFDVDPALDPLALAGRGPAGSLGLDVLLLLFAALGLGAEAASGRRIAWGVLVLALVPVPVVLVHGWGNGGDLWLGASWTAAIVGAVALGHLVRAPRLRRLALAMLAGVLGTLLVRGAANVTYEHDDLVAAFDTQREAFFADRGWDPRGANALIFERRLRQAQPLGWFVTTNVFAAFAAFGVVIGLGLTVAAHRGGRSGGWTGAFVLFALGCAVLLWMTGSRGAIAATAGGILLLAAGPPLARRWPRLVRLAPAIFVLGVGIALLGVVARGTLLPESFAGEKSLLFRWHYAQAAGEIVARHPWIGVGPDGFQAAYMQYRPPRNPEEVASAHSVFWDWLATLGLSASAWILLASGAVASGARRPPERREDGRDDPPDDVLLLVGAGAIGLGVAVAAEAHTLDAFEWTVRALGIVAFIGLAALVRVTLRGGAGRAVVGWSVGVGALVLLVHGQIELTFVQPGAVAWLAATIALAATSGVPPSATTTMRTGVRRIRTGLAIMAPVAVAGILLVHGWWPALQQQRAVAEAAAARAMAAERPHEPGVAHERAARSLLEAYRVWPTVPWTQIEAAAQLEQAAPYANPSEPVLRRALAALDPVIDRPGPAMVRCISLHRKLYARTGDATHVAQALALAQALADADPNGLSSQKRRADLLWDLDRRDDARMAYRRVLEIDADFELDPLKQLSERERAVVEQRAAPGN